MAAPLQALSQYQHLTGRVFLPGLTCWRMRAGTEEGGFAWLTLNYLLGHLGKAEDSTVAAIDLGGGSVQEAFALTNEEAKDAPKGYISTLSGGGKSYNVYVHRWACFRLVCQGWRFLARHYDMLLMGPLSCKPPSLTADSRCLHNRILVFVVVAATWALG